MTALTYQIEQADCIEWLDAQVADSIDLVLGSPPYMDARTYGIGAVYTCQEWVDWMLRVTEAAVRASKGLVLWVCSGVQRDKCYWPGCEGLAWEWWKRGNHLWRPCIWWKVDKQEGGGGIPGSGGKQWLRNDWEYVLAFKKEGWLPWADPLVMGHEPVYDRAGGEMSNRRANGSRANDDPWDKRGRGNSLCGRKQNGEKNLGTAKTSGISRRQKGVKNRADEENVQRHPMPKVANPGNCIIVKARVGGNHMGDTLCHENEAPFPEDLAEFFVRSFCPPGGVVCDPFSGSGTTAKVAKEWGRSFRGCDLRQSQVELTRRRLDGVQQQLFVD